MLGLDDWQQVQLGVEMIISLLRGSLDGCFLSVKAMLARSVECGLSSVVRQVLLCVQRRSVAGHRCSALLRGESEHSFSANVPVHVGDVE